MRHYRHPSIPGEPALSRITIWLPPSERDKIERDAGQARVSISGYLRELAKRAGHGKQASSGEET